MAVFSNLLDTLRDSGYVTPVLVIDLGLVAMVTYIVSSLVVPVWTMYQNAKQLDQLAGTTSRHWFFGHTKEYPMNATGITKSTELHRSFPTMFNHWFGPFMSALRFHHADTAAALLSSGAPKSSLAYKFVRQWTGDGLLVSKGDKWHRRRRLLTPAFHFNVLKSYIQVFNNCTQVLLGKWEAKVGEPVDISEDVCLMTLDAILQCAMSMKTDCQQSREKLPYINAVQDLAKIVLIRSSTPYLLPDFVFYRTKLGKRFKEAAKVVNDHGEKIISEHRHRHEQSKYESREGAERKDAEDFTRGGKKRLNFLDILLQTKDEDGKSLTNVEIREEVNTFTFGGHDTTTSGISWALHNLAKYADLQEKCREEVQCILGDKETMEWNDLAKLQYLTMFIKESFRLCPPVYGISRELHQPLRLRSHLNSKECIVPDGSTVALNIFALHRNTSLWDNAEIFDPDRHTKENSSKRTSHSYLPFSAGQRNCIGQNFAMTEMKTVLALVLRKYRLYLDDDTAEPVFALGITLQSKDGIFIKFERLDSD